MEDTLWSINSSFTSWFHRSLRKNNLIKLAALACFFSFSTAWLTAQTGGEGAVQGSVTDTSGAVVANATVTATNIDTGVKTTRPSSSAGLYNIAPLLPGTYTITATAAGFQKFVQGDVVIDAMHVAGLNITMQLGSENQTITVSGAPPALETTNSTLGGTIEGNEYLDLPQVMTGGQGRDITQFSNLLPGAQLNPGGRSSIIGGTAQRVGELYLDGLALTTITQQGDNRPIFNVVPIESIDQVQVVTSGFSAEYEGAGLENYTLKSGTSHLHGSIVDFVRNSAFDTWGFSAPWATIPQPNGTTPYANQVESKPAEHYNELSATIGGPVVIPHVFNGANKLFFNATIDRLSSSLPPSYSFNTLPTTLMQQGNFCQLLTPAQGGCGATSGTNTAPGFTLYDPTTLKCPTPTTCTRGPIAGLLNGLPTPNVIPAGEISPISQYLQKFLPALTNQNLTSNYIGGIPSGYRNFLWAGRVDYDLSPRQILSFAASNGRRVAVPYTSGTADLPVPYLAATLSTVVGSFADVEHTFTITPQLVNQFAAGYAYFGGPPVRNNTEGNPLYEETAAGITNLPTGQASDEFPGVTFAGTDAGTAWSQPDSTNRTASHTFDIVDNLNWVHGKHSFTYGIQLQDLMANVSTENTYSYPITYAYSPNDTAQISNANGVPAYQTNLTGFSYASFLLGAVDSTSTTVQPFSDIGARYHTIAPYVQDDYKVTTKLTLNLGLRWDYLPSFREVLNRWSFLNPNEVNPYTGNMGSLEFAGNYGGPGVSCGCTSPVNTYWKNWGPRLGFAYAVDNNTVFRGGFSMLYSHGGGTGGAAANGTGQTGFNTPISFAANPAGPEANPVFYLNNSSVYQSEGLANTAFGGPGFTLPTPTAPSATTQLTDGLVGNFVNSAGAFVKSNNGIAYADPYYGDRTPTFYFYNFGLQRSVTNNITLTANWAGSISHFLAGASNIRGLQSGEINPAYLPLGSLLTAPATPTNVAAAQAILPGCCTAPYPGFTAAAETTAGATFATIGQGLKWKPQFSGTTDPWGESSANAVYNALEISLAIRHSHGLTLNVNYTYSKEIDDAGTIRTGFAVPGYANISGKSFAADRLDRSISTLDSPENLAIYGVYRLPFGQGKIGGSNFLVRALASGWDFSNIFAYSSGYPLTLSSSACTSSTYPGQGTCEPDLNPNFLGHNIRTNGKWGQGVTALTLGTKSYVNGYVSNTTPGDGVGGVACGLSSGPFCNSGAFMIGDAPRTAAFGLRSPSNFRLTSGLRRTFDLTERYKFIFGVDCQNVTNSVTFGDDAGNLEIPTNVNNSNFGTLNYASSDSRDFQFSGRLSF